MDPRDENRSSAPATPEETLKALEAMLPEPEQLTLDRAAVFDEDLAAKKARREKQQRPHRPRPDRPRSAPLPERDQLSFTAPAVLDEDLAARKAGSPAPMEVLSSSSAPSDIFSGADPESLAAPETDAPVAAPAPQTPARSARPPRDTRAEARPAAGRARRAPSRERDRKAQKTRFPGAFPVLRMDTLLYSGETVATAGSRILRQFAVLAVCVLLLFGVLWGKTAAGDFLISNDFSEIYDDDAYFDPVSVSFASDPQTLPSGYAAAQAVVLQLGGRVESGSFAKSRAENVFPDEVLSCVQDALPGYSVELDRGVSDRDLLISIYDSLSAGRPVVVVLGEVSGFHYGVVTEMNTQEDALSVVDPESGIAARYSTDDFLEATKFQSYQKMPFTDKLAVTVGAWSKNTAVFINDYEDA